MNKYIVGMPNSFCGYGKEFFGLNGDKTQLVGSGNPNMADSFALKKDAKCFIEKYVVMDEIQIYKLNNETQKYLEWLAEGPIYRTMPVKSVELSRQYNNESPEEVLKWHLKYLENQDSVTYDDYQTWPKLYSVFNHLWEINSCYDKETYSKLEYRFSICVRPTSSLDTFKSEMKLIQKYAAKLYDKNDDVVLDVFDHYLSEYGNSVQIICHNEPGKKQWKSFSVTPRHRYLTSHLKNVDINKLFEYLKKERYYE